MRYQLPPMNALKVFEAAGCHLSFKAAARELQITPSAVSHGVQTLEEWLGQPTGICRTRLLRDTLVHVASPGLVAGDHAQLLHRLPLLRLVDRPDDGTTGSTAPASGVRTILGI